MAFSRSPSLNKVTSFDIAVIVIWKEKQNCLDVFSRSIHPKSKKLEYPTNDIELAAILEFINARIYISII